MYPADRPVRAWRRTMDGNGEFKSDVAFAVGPTWEDEVPRWFNVSLVNVEDRTTVESSKLLPGGTTEEDLKAQGYYPGTVGGMLNFVQTLARWVEEAEAREKALEAKHKDDMEALAADAHQWADNNELCSAFDEFMEEHGLPARPRDWTVKVEVPITLEFTVEDMPNAEDARHKAERYVEQEIRSLNDIAGMDVAWVGDADGAYAEVIGY
nr:MAG TPA: hypothetical protein [Caudoviricetes sp.]